MSAAPMPMREECILHGKFDCEFCTAAPSAEEGRYSALPDELKNSKSWLTFKFKPRADGKKDKVPYDPITGKPTNDPSRGVDFQTALAAESKYDGLGFYVEAPYIVIDIDNCVTPATGDVELYAAKIVLELNSYTEASPSGTGLHIWVRGTKPGDKCRAGIEIYSTKRFMTVTGTWVPATPKEIREVDITSLYNRMLAEEFVEPAKAPATNNLVQMPAAQIQSTGNVITSKLELLLRGDILSTKPFVIGDAHGNDLQYPSQSEADAALCALLAIKYNGDAEKIDADFRISSLFRKKWDEKHGKTTYGAMTINSAVALVTSSVEPEDIGEESVATLVTRPKLLTEVGNGRRLIESYGRIIRYCAEKNIWIYFNGKVWLPDDSLVHVHDLMKRMLIELQKDTSLEAPVLSKELENKLTKDLTPKKISVPLTVEELEEATKAGSKARVKKIEAVLSAEEQQQVENYRAAKTLRDWAVLSESNHAIQGSVQQARSEPGVTIAESVLDANIFICNVLNGRLEFDPQTFQMMFGKHRRDDFATKMMPVVYDPDATCPLFDWFLQWMFPEKGVRDFVLAFLALGLTGISVREFLVLWGEGGNGKSTLMKVLYHMFGAVLDKNKAKAGGAYIRSTAFSTFTVGRDQSAGSHRADLVPLAGARLITASESNQKNHRTPVILDVARIKEMTGGDPTTARGAYDKNETVFVNQGKIILQTNNLPSINDTTQSVRDRLRLVECGSRIEEKDQDKQLSGKLIAESSGILNRFIQALATYARKGLIETESMKKSAEGYLDAENQMGRFVEEKCEIVTQETVRTPASLIYAEYTKWCSVNGESEETQIALTQYLTRKCKVTKRRTDDARLLCKIRLKTATISSDPAVEVDI
jgi:putative DNA primase/helicase